MGGLRETENRHQVGMQTEMEVWNQLDWGSRGTEGVVR